MTISSQISSARGKLCAAMSCAAAAAEAWAPSVSPLVCAGGVGGGLVSNRALSIPLLRLLGAAAEEPRLASEVSPTGGAAARADSFNESCNT